MAEVPKMQEHFSGKAGIHLLLAGHDGRLLFLRLSSEPKGAVQKWEQGRVV
jgi:hypothetical protein